MPSYFYPPFFFLFFFLKIFNGLGGVPRRCQKVGGGGGGTHKHVIYVPSVKNQYKRVVFRYIVIY